jgi:formylmethanofuran dehydrogenase subunit E
MMIDTQVKYLLKQPPERLFRIEMIEREYDLTEVPSVYLTCCRCNEQVLSIHAVEYGNQVYCLSCFQLMKSGNSYDRLQ